MNEDTERQLAVQIMWYENVIRRCLIANELNCYKENPENYKDWNCCVPHRHLTDENLRLNDRVRRSFDTRVQEANKKHRIFCPDWWNDVGHPEVVSLIESIHPTPKKNETISTYSDVAILKRWDDNFKRRAQIANQLQCQYDNAKNHENFFCCIAHIHIENERLHLEDTARQSFNPKIQRANKHKCFLFSKCWWAHVIEE